MKPTDAGTALQVKEEWGAWADAERSSHDAFLQRTPADRLAWLEDLLKLRRCATTGSTGAASEAST